MTSEKLDEKAIFNVARQIDSPRARLEYLRQVCAADADLLVRVETLLRAYEEQASFLESPPAGNAFATIDQPVIEKPGTQIGPYKLLQQIGEGGMGTVFMAEQTQPVQRNVALKIIKPGMDSGQVVARFEAERQALALMDHPHIAKVLDAGTTGSGRPYFVMELVKGLPITKYCDERRLAPKQRLELLVSVCQAVQHAHQKGVIHRDLKPSNVLVAEYDDQAVAKVIDFGVAKATGSKLTERTMFTEFGQIVGTLEYMSPEQAKLNALDIDTRSDIYALGVLLYELLTGTTPLEKKRFREAAFDEMLRIIREEEPPKPSTRLSTVDDLPSIAANRSLEPRKLSGLVRGELDWIVMKALEKNRNRRYETANGFALDIQRYLADEAVQACPPSAAYRIRKFARRNRGPVLAAALVLIAVLVGIAGTTMGLLQARDERDRVRAAQEKERLALIEAEENFQTAREAVDKMYTRAAEEMRDKPQVEQIRRALLEDVLRFYRGFLKKKNDDPAIRYESALSQRRVGEIYGFLGDLKESLENYQQATAMLAALSPEFASDVNHRDELARAHAHTGYVLLNLRRFEEGDASLQKAMALWEPLANEFPDRPSYLEDLARANSALGQAWTMNYQARGNPFVTRGQELLARLKQRFPGHEISAAFRLELNRLTAWRYTALPHDAATLALLEKECREQLAAAEAAAREYPDAPEYQNKLVDWLGRLGNVLLASDRLDEAEQLGNRGDAIRTRLAAQYPDNPEYQKNMAYSHYNRGHFLYATNRPDQALDHFRKAIAIASDIADKYPENARALTHLREMIGGCPAGQLRDPQRVLALAQRLKELGAQTWDHVAVAQLDAGQYREVLETCEKANRDGQQSGVTALTTAVAYWHLGKQAEARELARQIMQNIDSQPNQYWYVPEYRWRVREISKLMGLEGGTKEP
jgi:serine/threonine protein kinase